jgi:hypothetical protein
MRQCTLTNVASRGYYETLRLDTADEMLRGLEDQADIDAVLRTCVRCIARHADPAELDGMLKRIQSPEELMRASAWAATQLVDAAGR